MYLAIGEDQFPIKDVLPGTAMIDGENLLTQSFVFETPVSEGVLNALCAGRAALKDENGGVVQTYEGYVHPLAYQVTVAQAGKAAELEQVLADARAGLIAAPEAGEAWDAAKWYRSGDTVMHGAVGYTCRKTCKGREPGVSGPIPYWEAAPKEEPGTVLAWGEIAGGEMIPVGQIVTHNDKTWRCIKAHAKSVIRQPSAVQTEYWEAVG